MEADGAELDAAAAADNELQVFLSLRNSLQLSPRACKAFAFEIRSLAGKSLSCGSVCTHRRKRACTEINGRLLFSHECMLSNISTYIVEWEHAVVAAL